MGCQNFFGPFWVIITFFETGFETGAVVAFKTEQDL